MKKPLFFLILFVYLLTFFNINAQNKPKKLGELTIAKIMRDPLWIGGEPKNLTWSDDSKTLYFSWNPKGAKKDSSYKISFNGISPVKCPEDELKNQQSQVGAFNTDESKMVYSKAGDIFILDVKTKKTAQLTFTSDNEANPFFSLDGTKIFYAKGEDFYSISLTKSEIKQLVKFVEQPVQNPAGALQAKIGNEKNAQDKWIETEEMKLIQVLRDRKERTSSRFSARRNAQEPKTGLVEIKKGSDRISGIVLSPDEKFVSYISFKTGARPQSTLVPNYVTESGYTTDIPGRSKVGNEPSSSDLFICNLENGKILKIDREKIPGIFDLPKHLQTPAKTKYDKPREIRFNSPEWSADGKYAVAEATSFDQKDRWIFLLNPENGELKCLDWQHDEAWVEGPGIGGFYWMPDNKKIWFQSEESGYSHIYTIELASGKKEALTNGKFEIYNPQISKDKKFWYFTSNEVHPGVTHFYKMPINGGKRVQITSEDGNNEVSLSPDEKTLAIRYSYSNKPWELFLMKNEPGAKMVQITESLTDEFKSYNWRDPEVVTFKAEDGKDVYARLYKPVKAAENHPAVIFVHGAGYLQNAHKWWSSYFREYMFHNLLADLGYTVLDIDYRGSSGYGRDWRTDIYRYMGDKDLTDHVDGAKYLVSNHGVNPQKIGLYGGSYGGFITLMAMFTKQDYFAAGAALRSVTDWAHYNHAYTAARLNTPVADSLAYAQSSPIYFAEGLRGALLICHGMIDTNVHFQDVVRLSQRLIELGKDNWEMAVYPLEDHGFVEPSSWTDEYKRILKLFETNLK